MQRKRTKPRVTWLPHTDTANIIRPLDNRALNVINFQLDIGGGIGDTVTGVVPVVIDDKQDPLAAGTTLSDIENSGYRLRRIVGKCFAGVQQLNNGGPGAVFIGAGFIVLRVDEAGSLPLAANLDQYNIFDTRNDDFPWIWKREWILSNGSAGTGASTLDYPFTNAEYGSVADGPHIDQKTARVISDDERLFFVASGFGLVTTGPQDTTGVRFLVSARVLASMRTTLGNRRNASR